LAVKGNGGGIQTVDANELLIKDSSIKNNEAREGYGGGIASTGTLLLHLETDENMHCCVGKNGISRGCSTEQAGCVPTLIQNNSALESSGGGIYVGGTRLVLQGVRLEKDPETGLAKSSTKLLRQHVGIVKNSAQVGAGLFLTGSSTAKMTTSWIKKNKAKYDGGGIAAEKCTFSIVDSMLQNNIATSRGGGVYLGRLTTVEMNSTDVHRNWVEGNGGGIFVGLRSELMIRQSSISYNKGQGDGAGLYVVDTMVRIDDTQFIKNGLETGQGAGMCGSGASSIICRHCNFEGNAIMEGGRGGALSLTGTSGALLLSSKFTQNRADIGGAIFLKDSAMMTAATEATVYDKYVSYKNKR
jgi:predicted outer membrane repeat protein